MGSRDWSAQCNGQISHQKRTEENTREECDCWTRYLLMFSAQVIAAVDSTQRTNLSPFVKSGMYFSILHQTKPLQAQSHFPLSQLQMSPLACLQWALCCFPVMACEISIIIIMAPRAAMSADGRSLIGNELSHHPKGTCLSLCYSEVCSALTVCTGIFYIWRWCRFRGRGLRKEDTWTGLSYLICITERGDLSSLLYLSILGDILPVAEWNNHVFATITQDLELQTIYFSAHMSH